jgi:sorting nexin-25
MYGDCAATSSFSLARLNLIKVCPLLFDLTVERLASEGRASNRKNVDGLLKRLEEIKAVLDERVVVLSGKATRRVRPSRELSNNQRSTLIKPPNATRLSDLLMSSSGQSYFMEFMDRRGRMRLIQFWLLVNNIKDPLEDADSDSLPQHSTWTENDIDDLSAILNGYFSDSSIDVDEDLKNDLASFLQDPSKATAGKYQRARKAILITQQSVYQNMEREDWPLFRKTDLWHKYLAASESAPTTPAKLAPPAPVVPKATEMTRSHSTGTIPSRASSVGPPPKNESATDLRRLLRMKNVSRIPSDDSRPSTDDPLSQDADDPLDMPTSNPQQSEEDVVNAISAALNDIIKSDSKEDVASIHSRNSSEMGDRVLSNSARSSSDFSRVHPDLQVAVSPNENRRVSDRSEASVSSEPAKERVPIFDDDDDYRPDFAIEMLTKTAAADDSKGSGLGIHFDIIEELEMVEVEVERLKREIRLTTSMIAKAELTGSYEELRLLKGSRSSMERELARKEQLRDTYADQDGEHSLTVCPFISGVLTEGTVYD